MSRKAEGGEEVQMISLFAAIALLIFAGVAGLVAMVIALYAVSVAFDAESRRRNKDKEE